MLDRRAVATAFTAWAFGVSLGACRTDSVTPAQSVDDLRSAPERVEIDGREYVLRTSLWRDFMPISPPGGKPMIAIVRIVETDSAAIPPELEADSVWVIADDEVWAASLDEEPRESPAPFVLEKIARGGPRWAPGSSVDVVVRLRAGSSRSHLLRAADQLIARTD